MSKNMHDEWVKYPVGKMGKGAWCDCCKRYSVRNTTTNVIGVRDGRVLMILRKTDPQKGWWGLVGGYIDWGETVEECVRREFMEETGREIGKLTLLGVYSDPGRDLDGRQNVDHCYYGEVGKKVGEIDAGEVVEARWFDLEALPEKIAFDHGKMLEEYREKVIENK